MRRMPLNAEELDKFLFLSGNFQFQNEERYENASKIYPYNEIVKTIKKCKITGKAQPIILFDISTERVYVGTILSTNSIVCYYLDSATSTAYFDLEYRENEDALDCYLELDDVVVEDSIQTIFGQSISGTGNIELYRHQMTITNANDVSVVYIVESANDSVINSSETFVNVTKATTSYTGLASYLDTSGNIQPAFIRYSAGNVIIQLQNGSVSPMKSVSDIVTPISL